MTSLPEESNTVPPVFKLLAVENWSNKPPTEAEMLKAHINHIYEEVSTNRKLIIALIDAINKVPKQPDYEQLKKELDKIKTDAVSTLTPLREYLNGVKESEERASEMVGYG